ncbi:terpenoid synthase [Dentipellis sp. KUC8613]|nr:terpenoid synthase [Dentipellis sp. KUC8613]
MSVADPRKMSTTTKVFDDKDVTRFVVPVGSDLHSRSATKFGHAEISGYINSFLHRCGFVHAGRSDFAEMESECLAISIAREYVIPEDNSFRRFIPTGVAIAWNAYHHLPDKQTQKYIALLTSLFIYAEDMFKDNNDAILAFHGLFIRRQPQKHRMLDHLANMLLDLPSHFPPTSAVNIMISASLNFITAVGLENGSVVFSPPASASRYPAYARMMSGVSEVYAFFIFTPNIPLDVYLPALPDMMTHICYANDILSFYKEELAGEEENLVYTLARCRGVHPSVALQEVIDDAVAAHRRVLETLMPHKAAFDCYVQFAQGYTGFHIASKRYRLDELQG